MPQGIQISGDEMKKIRQELMLTQAEMAEAIGMSESGWQRIEQAGDTAMLVRTFRKLAELLGVKRDDLRSRVSPVVAA